MFRQYLVTGATGFLGRAVISVLLKKNMKIRALVLAGDPLVRDLPGSVEPIVGDVCDGESLEGFFADADEDTCVIHCAGIVSVASNPGEHLYRVNVEGTRIVLQKCISHHVGKLIYVSSVHAIPEEPKGTEIVETRTFSPTLVWGDYAKSKAMATNLVLEAAARGLDASIVFPSGIIGPGDAAKGNITQMLLSFLSGRLPFAVRGGYDFVDVRDVARGIISCAENGEAGQGYILSGHYATIRELLEMVKSEANLRQRICCLPIALAKLAAPFYEKYSLRYGKPLYFTPYAVAVLDSNGLFSHRAAEQAFGYAPRPIQVTLRDTVMWLQGGGEPYEKTSD